MSCIYKFKLNNEITPALTEQLLLTILASVGKTSLDSVIKALGNSNEKYSMSFDDTHEAVENAIKSEKSRLEFVKSKTPGGEYSFNKAISACLLLEKHFREYGNKFPSLTNIGDYIEYVIDQELRNPNNTKSRDELEQEAAVIAKHWKTIMVDGMLLHGTIPFLMKAALAEEKSERSDLTLESINKANLKIDEKLLKDRLSISSDLVKKFLLDLNNHINDLMKGSKAREERGDDSDLFSSINLSAELQEHVATEADRVGVHIDRLYIDKYGHIHVFNFKFTSHPSIEWKQVKKDKYELEMGLIKEILEKNGISTEGSAFHNIPILLIYDDSEEDPKITGITFEKALTLNVTPSGTQSPIIQAQTKIQNANLLKPTLAEQNIKISPLTLTGNLKESDEFLRCVIPTYNAEATGLTLSAKAWIKSHAHSGVIGQRKDGKSGWHVVLPDGTNFDVDDPSSPTKNQEILEKVELHIESLNKELKFTTSWLVQCILDSYDVGYPTFALSGYKHSEAFLGQVLSKYFEKDEQGNLLWKPLTVNNAELNNLKIFLFQNTVTGQIDTVNISGLKLRQAIDMKYERSGLLGMYESDLEGATKLKACYGHMEFMRAAAILNAIILDIPNAKLGDIHVISPYYGGEAMYKPAKFVIKEFGKIMTYINGYLQGKKFHNNFKAVDFVDQTISIIKLADLYLDKQKYDLTNLRTAESDSAKVAAARIIMDHIQDDLRAITPKEILDHRRDPNVRNRILVEIYEKCVQIVNYYTGFLDVEEKYINSFKRYVLPQYANPDANLRHLGNLYSRELDKYAQDFQKIYNPAAKFIDEFEQEKGFNGLKTTIIGSAEKLYEKMYRRDPNTGKNLWEFVDPYDNNQVIEYGLDAQEVLFLKKALFHFAKIRARARGNAFNFTSIEDPALKAYREDNQNNYFIVPLTKGSNAHRHRNLANDKVNKAKQAIERVSTWSKFKAYLREKLEPKAKEHYIDGKPDESSIYNYDKDTLSSKRRMLLSENDNDSIRSTMLNSESDSYWETNIGYLLADYTAELLEYEHLSQVEFYGKNMLFNMYLVGELEGAQARKLINESMSYLSKYMELNIYGKSPMSDFGKSFVDALSLPNRIMKDMYLAGNLRSMARDTFEGIWQNFMRTITHYDTDLSRQALIDGYKEVMRNMFQSDRALNIMAELCLRYRLSNTDTAKVQERAKKGRGGIFDPEYMAFGTLRGPDFLNRMTLFVARCIQDGVWPAFSIKDHLLVYNPKKDARFRAFFEESEGSEAYLKAKSAYFSAIRLYNLEHSEDLQITVSKEGLLPEPYSQNEVEKIKNVAEKIYGAYDRSQKAWYENMALGHTLGVFSTWFNGHTAAWLMEEGQYNIYYTSKDKDGNPIIAKNDAGNELWFDRNGCVGEKRSDGKLYDEKTGEEMDSIGSVPVIGNIPIQVQGILYTLKESWRVLRDGFLDENLTNAERIKAFKDNVLSYEVNRANYRKVFGDLFGMMLYGLLFGMLFTPMYKDHKKAKECDNVLADALIELLYKSTFASFDGFFGPIAVLKYALDDIDPMVASVNINLVKDMSKVVFGDKAFGAFVYGNAPVFRTFKDTARMYDPDLFKKLPED